MEDICTVFIGGLPIDVKERELNLLFREQPGFLGVVLRSDGMGRPMGFANFDTHVCAVSAIGTLNDVVLDPTSGDKLRLELARAASRSLTKRTRDGDAEVPPPKISQSAKGPTGMFTGNRRPSSLGLSSAGGSMVGNTIFITGLGPQTSAAFMQELCCAFPGFERLKVDHEGENNACCFARFQTPLEAQTALDQLQGCVLPSNATLRCEYARSDLGRRNSVVNEAPMAFARFSGLPSYSTPSSSTLFLSGLGDMISTADMMGLCQALPGFVKLKVDHEGQRNACCFVLFQSPADASYAMQHLAGCEVVGSADGRRATLRCEFAKSDLGSKATEFIAAPALHYQLDPYSFQRMIPQLHVPGRMPALASPLVSAPSSTLFLSALGPDSTSDELTAFCHFLPGFDRLKLDHEGQPKACAFVRFLDPNCARAAMTRLLQQPFKGRMLKVEFAKQDLGRK